jgi:branched-chain amino acid transport system substrate-binding protein
VKEFDRAFSERYGKRPDAQAAQAYDALKLLAHAIQQAGTTAPSKVSQALRNTRDWIGVTGPHTFNQKGDVVDKPLDLQIVRNRKFELITE